MFVCVGYVLTMMCAQCTQPAWQPGIQNFVKNLEAKALHTEFITSSSRRTRSWPILVGKKPSEFNSSAHVSSTFRGNEPPGLSNSIKVLGHCRPRQAVMPQV